MSTRSQKQAAHQRTKQRKTAQRARKEKRSAGRAESKQSPRQRQALESQGQQMEARMELLERQKQWMSSDPPRCGLCGATKNLTRTECCGQWICDDEHKYRLFSSARNSCYRNHRRYTLCASHFNEEHSGRWQDCDECQDDLEPEMYVYYGTNEYNFEILEHPPEYEPARCHKCGRVIVLGEGGYMSSREGYTCMDCAAIEHPFLR